MASSNKLTYGSYEVLQNPDGSPCVLGQGSFGVTYKARHSILGRITALKVIREDLLNRGSREDKEETNRFLNEARAVGKLNHPGIAMVHECALDNGVFYYAMEYCDGGTLHDFCVNSGPMPWSEVRRIAIQIASALDYAHANGFLHRDIKPANIMLNGEAKSRQAKLIDFGLAKKFTIDTESSSATVRNDQENFRGNFATASPEQILEKPLDQRSDLFSLGVTLWWLLIGGNPFSELKRGSLIADRVGPSSYASALPGDLDAEARRLLEGLLQKNAEDRTATAHQVVELLHEAASPISPTKAVSPVIPLEPLAAPLDWESCYELRGIIASASHVEIFACENCQTRQPFVAIIPNKGINQEALGGMRVAASRRLDFGAYRFTDWRVTGFDDVFVISKPEGCSLLGILRKFGSARFSDALPFLAHLARCFDASQAWTTLGIQVDPGEILVRARDGLTELGRFNSWSDIDPQTVQCLPFFSSDSDHGASSEATLSSSTQEFHPLAQFAALVYRVLAGSAVRYAAFFTSSGYVMASGLSEDGNSFLADTICSPDTQSSACRFLQMLASMESLPFSELTPLVNPPSAEEIEIGKLVPTRTHRPAAITAAHAPTLHSDASTYRENAAPVTDKIAELELQLAQARRAAEDEESLRLAEEKARREAEAKEHAENEARRREEETRRKANEEMARQSAEAKRLAEELKHQAAEAQRLADEAHHKVEQAKRKEAEEKQRLAAETERQRAEQVRRNDAERALKDSETRKFAEERARQATVAAGATLHSGVPHLQPLVGSDAPPVSKTNSNGSKRRLIAIAAGLVVIASAATAIVLNRGEPAKTQTPVVEQPPGNDTKLDPEPPKPIEVTKTPEPPKPDDPPKVIDPPKAKSIPVMITMPDPADNIAFNYNGIAGFAVEEVGGKAVKFEGRTAKIEGAPGSKWKVTLLARTDGKAELPLASVTLVLPESSSSGSLRPISVRVPEILPQIEIINPFDFADYTQIKVSATPSSRLIPDRVILLNDDSKPRLITSLELTPESSIIDRKPDPFPKKGQSLRVPLAGRGDWTITYTGSRIGDKSVALPNLGTSGRPQIIKTPSPFSGRHSLVARMTDFPDRGNSESKPTSTPPTAAAADLLPEVDYFNEMVYLEKDEEPRKFRADIFKKNLVSTVLPHYLCVVMELDLRNGKNPIDGTLSVLLTYPHVLFAQYQGNLIASEINPAGALMLKFSGTKGFAGEWNHDGIKSWSSRYTKLIEAQEDAKLNDLIRTSLDEWVTFQQLRDDTNKQKDEEFMLDFGKWDLEDYASSFRFELLSSGGVVSMNKAVQIYTKGETYVGHANKADTPAKIGAVLLKAAGNIPERNMRTQH